jgi:hypothetical protein
MAARLSRRHQMTRRHPKDLFEALRAKAEKQSRGDCGADSISPG